LAGATGTTGAIGLTAWDSTTVSSSATRMTCFIWAKKILLFYYVKWIFGGYIVGNKIYFTIEFKAKN
jgi:hypothetical protein